MYIPWLLIIIFAILFYKIGFNKGRQDGRHEMQDELVDDPELYAKLRYDHEELLAPLDDN